MKTGGRNKLKHISTGRNPENEHSKIDENGQFTMPSIPANVKNEPLVAP